MRAGRSLGQLPQRFRPPGVQLEGLLPDLLRRFGLPRPGLRLRPGRQHDALRTGADQQLPGRLRLRQRAPAAPAALRVGRGRVPGGLRRCVDFPRSSVLTSGRMPGGKWSVSRVC
eukprot:scaffold9737_cov72-Phaeocystis_antarctica.AAC.1